MPRTVSDEQARITQDLQAQAAVRRLSARLARIKDKPETEGYQDFLAGCLRGVVSPPVFIRKAVA